MAPVSIFTNAAAPSVTSTLLQEVSFNGGSSPSLSQLFKPARTAYGNERTAGTEPGSITYDLVSVGPPVPSIIVTETPPMPTGVWEPEYGSIVPPPDITESTASWRAQPNRPRDEQGRVDTGEEQEGLTGWGFLSQWAALSAVMISGVGGCVLIGYGTHKAHQRWHRNGRPRLTFDSGLWPSIRRSGSRHRLDDGSSGMQGDVELGSPVPTYVAHPGQDPVCGSVQDIGPPVYFETEEAGESSADRGALPSSRTDAGPTVIVVDPVRRL